ncbi:MAG: cytochrome c [Solirubrobacterales bacterium]
MGKRTYITFGVFALVFAVLIPAWAISREGGQAASPENVPADLQPSKELFATNCGSCHTLAKAGTDGIVGPNLDKLLGSASPDANKQRVLNAVNNGINGRMPKGILSDSGPGSEAEQVATFVAQVAGQ